MTPFTTYEEAQAWIEQKIQEYGGRNKFFASDEYKRAYPGIQRLHKGARSDFGSQKRSELEQAGLKVGDRVEYTSVSQFGFTETFSGTIVMKKGEPWVKLDQPAPKKSQRWSRAWRRATTRAKNPVPIMLAGAAFGVGIVCGAAVTFFRIGGRTMEYGEYVELEDIEGAILLFGHDGSLVDEVIDVYSHRKGICHAALHVGLTDNEGNPMLIESWPRTGVRLRSPDDYKEREVIVVPLSVEETEYARHAALAHLHRRTPYRGRPHGLTCSEFVVACLPPRLRKRFPKDRLVTPVDLAMGLVEDHSTKQLKNKLLK